MQGVFIMIDFTDSQTRKKLSVFRADLFQYGSKRQKIVADSICAKYIIITGDNRGRLPEWKKRIFRENHLWFRKIGRTTYKTNTFALYDQVSK
jgi:hypothetical protein